MSIRRALAFAYVEKYGSFLVSLVSTVVISRLLAPEEIGVFSIGMAIVGLVGVLREFGISTYLIQEPELGNTRIRAAFTMTIGIGWAMAAIVLVVSAPAGHFYADSRVTSIIAIMSLAFALTPFGGVAQALLSRELQFGKLAWIRLTHGIVLAGSSVAMAWYGLGAESLAWAAVVATAVSTVMSLVGHPHDMRPVWNRVELRRVLQVGGVITAVSIIDEITASLPEAALGRLQSMASVGLFSRGRTMSQMAHQVLARAAGPVFLAAFSELKRNSQPLGPGYVKATACIVGLGWSILGVLATLAEPLVMVLFGANWMGVVTPLRWLCLGAAIALLTSGAQHLLMADGAVNEVFKAKALALPGHLACIAAGAMIGLDGMAIGLVISAIQSSALLAWAVRHRLGLTFREQFAPALMGLPLALAASAGAAPALLVFDTHGTAQAIVRLGLGMSAAALLAGFVLAFGTHPLKLELIRALRQSRLGALWGDDWQRDRG